MSVVAFHGAKTQDRSSGNRGSLFRRWLLTGAVLVTLSGCTGTDLSFDPTLGLQTTTVPKVDVGANAQSAANSSETGESKQDVAAAAPAPTQKPSTEAKDTEVAAASPAVVPTETIVAAAPTVETAEAESAKPQTAPKTAAEAVTRTVDAAPKRAERNAGEKKRPNLLAMFGNRTERAKATRRRDNTTIDRKSANPVAAAATSREGSKAERRAKASERPAKARRTVRRSGSVTVIKPRRGGVGKLPGVRSTTKLFGIARDENDGMSSFRVASAAGLARRSGNGFLKQTSSVSTECFKPRLVSALRKVERHFGRPVMVTSGYRSPKHNARAGGAKGSKHVTCEAADIQVEGVSRSKVAAFLRSMPERGGVGTYCHTKSVHYDIGSQRDWSWGCRKRRKRR